MSDFDDGKDAGALRTIGEVSDGLGVKPHVLRYWEQQFPMLKPLKRSGGRRYYRPEDISLVETIDRLVNREGYTLKGAKAAIRAGKTGGSGEEMPTVLSIGAAQAGERMDAAEFLPQLKAIRSRLAAIIEV